MIKKPNKEQKRKMTMISRLKKLLGIDFCACGTSYRLECDGICRHVHTKSGGKVECGELYQVDPALVKPKKKNRKPKFRDINVEEKKKRRDRRHRENQGV